MLKIREWLRRRNKSKELQILAQNLSYPSLMRPSTARISKKLNQYLANILECRTYSSGRIIEILFVISLKLTTYRLKLIRFSILVQTISIPINLKISGKDNRRFLGNFLHPLQTKNWALKVLKLLFEKVELKKFIVFFIGSCFT